MNEWFTIEQIDPATYAISEYQHWEETHCYLLLGDNKALLIDAGLGVDRLWDVIRRITDLPIIVVLTHVHWDHIGGLKYFEHIGVHEQEVSWLVNFPLPLSVVKANLLKETCTFPPNFVIEDYHVFQGAPSQILKDMQMLSVGNRIVQALHTPGHSPGHLCFYEASKGYLFTGDLIYQGTLDAFYPSTDPLQYMRSIKKVMELPIKKLLPGHHKIDIPITIINQIDCAFTSLNHQGLLRQGNGVYQFEGFKIHL